MIQTRFFSALALLAIAAAACGGGGGGGGGSVPAAPNNTTALNTPSVTTTVTPNVVPSGYAPTAFKISLPKGTYASSATRRTGQNIGTGTQSIVLTLLQQNGVATTGTPQPFGLTSSSPGCALNATTQALNCTLSVNAPIGQDVFLAQTFDGANGTGNLTGSGAVQLSVGINSTNTAAIVLNAQVAGVAVVAASYYLGAYYTQGAAKARAAGRLRPMVTNTTPPTINSTPVYVVAYDNLGNIILNPSSYNSPVYLQLAFDASYYYTDTADVTLAVTYAAGDPNPCTPGQTVSTNAWYGSVAVCSPSDVITASLSATGGPDPSDFVSIYGWISASSLIPTPAPSSTPMPTPMPSTNNYATIQVNYATPTPPGTLPITVQ